MWNPHFKVLISLETVWEAGRWLRAEWGQGYRRNQPRHSPVLRVSLFVSLTFGFIPSLKILSATSVVQRVSRLPSGRGLSWWGRSGDRYYPSGLISPAVLPFLPYVLKTPSNIFFFFKRTMPRPFRRLQTITQPNKSDLLFKWIVKKSFWKKKSLWLLRFLLKKNSLMACSYKQVIWFFFFSLSEEKK